jgi:hypothetical protein
MTLQHMLSLLALLTPWMLGAGVSVAEEIRITGVKGSAMQGKITVEILQVTLEEGKTGAAVNLSLRVTAASGKPEALAMKVPALSREGEASWSEGLLALTRVEGLEHFHSAPDTIIWWFELRPPSIDTAHPPKVFFIDGKKVTEKAYKKRLSTLSGQEHWSCAETNEGGITSWEAKDPAGKRYQVRAESGGGNRNSITRILSRGP